MAISWRRIWITTGILVTLTVALGITELWQISIRETARGVTRFTWIETAFLVLPSWIVMALLTPWILYLAEAFPLAGPRLRVNVVIHALAGFAFALLHLSATSWITVAGVVRWTYTDLMTRVFGTYMVYDLLNYWLIVGIAHAIQYYGKYRERELTALQLERSLSVARLQALRGQLNPHFLYNTLNSISTMALKGDQHAVVQTLAKLSDLLRAMLDEESGQEVPLRKELQLMDLYLEIQQIRFGDRLRIEKQIDPDCVDTLVPSMILQPLIENAVVHGIAPKPGHGTIAIRANRADGAVRLEVRDSGPGFKSPSPLTPLPEGRGVAGIGLNNTRERLSQLYGETQSFECRNAPEGGAAVTITIPLRGRNDEWGDDPDADRRRRTSGTRGHQAPSPARA